MWLTCALIALFAPLNCKGDENSSVQHRIFGGSVHKITDAPYFASFLASDQPVCGASIVSQEILITAAHCYLPEYKHSVRVGTDKIYQGSSYNVQKIVAHPKYRPSAFRYDIAVIKIVGRLYFDDRIFPIRLAPRDIKLKHGDMLTTMGFGNTESGKQGSDLLRVDIPYVSRNVCKKIIRQNVTDDILCAGGVEGYDSCQGDSGGPLVYKNLLVGVVSFSFVKSCGNDLPAGYARISAMRDFIDTTVRQLSSRRRKYNIEENYISTD